MPGTVPAIDNTIRNEIKCLFSWLWLSKEKRKPIFMIIQHGLMKEGGSGAPNNSLRRRKLRKARIDWGNKSGAPMWKEEHGQRGEERTMTCIRNMSSPRENYGEQKIPSLFVLAFRINGKTNMLSDTSLEALPFLGHYPYHVWSVLSQQEGNEAQEENIWQT